MNLLSNLPSFDNNHIVESIQHAYGIEADILNKEIDDVINQFFIDRATWGLDLIYIPIWFYFNYLHI